MLSWDVGELRANLKRRNFISHPGNMPKKISLDSLPEFCGQFSLVINESPNTLHLARDPLGINKLFWGISPKGDVRVADTIKEILRSDAACSSISSVPPGNVVSIFRDGTHETKNFLSPISEISPDAFSMENFRKRIDEKMSKAFEQISSKISSSTDVFVCLSGGLDSSLVAAYAAKYIPKVQAITFTLSETDENNFTADPWISEDFYAAREIAKAIGIPLQTSFASPKFSDREIADVINYAQDYRDFNVHCAMVNYFLARTIRERSENKNVVVLTGDIMNELMVDYKPVEFNGKVHYALPNVGKGRLRRFLSFGLDTSDREGGVFNHFQLSVLQPYSFVFQDYLKIPSIHLGQDDAKFKINAPILDRIAPGISHLILDKKIRAQVGGEKGGILGAFHEKNIHQEDILHIWQKHLSEISQGRLIDTMENGRYSFRWKP